MSLLEIKKKEVELMRVEAAKAELELKIAERLEEIERLKQSIQTQDNKITELKNQLSR